MLEGTVVAVEEATHGRSPVVRWWDVAVADVGGRIDLLRAGMQDGDPMTRLIAAGCLRARDADDPDVRATLRDLLRDDGYAWQARVLIADLRDPLAYPALLARADLDPRFVECLSYVEALPRLQRELLEGRAWEARRAIERLGPEAATLAAAVVARLRSLVDESAAGHDWLAVLGSVGDVGPAACGAEYLRDIVTGQICAPLEPALGWSVVPDLPRRPSRLFVVAAAEALARTGAAGREILGDLLDSDDEDRCWAAVQGLASAGELAAPWRDKCVPLLDHPSGYVAGNAGVILANTGELRRARDAWLEWELWPLNHHGTPPPFHHFASVLARRLGELLPGADVEDRARTERALETVTQRTRDATYGLW